MKKLNSLTQVLSLLALALNLGMSSVSFADDEAVNAVDSTPGKMEEHKEEGKNWSEKHENNLEHKHERAEKKAHREERKKHRQERREKRRMEKENNKKAE